MVPLVRPSIPHPSEWAAQFEPACATGQFSNFGPVWEQVSDRLTEMTGRVALPCASGTAAVALGILAASKQYVEYEAFTFQATALAAKSVNRHAAGVRTGLQSEEDGCMVRTVPFGSHREFGYEAGHLVIDAAGAFGPDAFRAYPQDAIIACSFHATKNFPIGEGGCVFLPKYDEYRAKTLRAAMNFGLDEHRNPMTLEFATNAKLDELHCALLMHQLDRESFFAERSERIGDQSWLLSKQITGAWLPYKLGRWQSLVVVAHKDPDALVAKLAEGGFTARRMYYPYVKPHLLSYDEASLVALPSDMTNDELSKLVEVANA
jgi:dTDP-4-amino-4,6-dideoxygalactose transaminase